MRQHTFIWFMLYMKRNLLIYYRPKMFILQFNISYWILIWSKKGKEIWSFLYMSREACNSSVITSAYSEELFFLCKSLFFLKLWRVNSKIYINPILCFLQIVRMSKTFTCPIYKLWRRWAAQSIKKSGLFYYHFACDFMVSSLELLK